MVKDKRPNSIRRTSDRSERIDNERNTDPYACFTNADFGHIAQAGMLKNELTGYICEKRRKQNGGRASRSPTEQVSFVEVRVERGSLLEPMHANNSKLRTELDFYYLTSNWEYTSEHEKKCFQYFHCIDLTDSDVYFGAKVPDDIDLLDAIEVSILKGVIDLEVRYELYWDRDLFHFIYTLRIHETVAVEILDSICAGRTKMVAGRVEFIGEPVPGKGTKYGIRLEEGEEGDMNGIVDGRRLFHAPDRGAVLIGAERLKRPTQQMLDRFNDSSFYMTSDADFDDSPPNSYRTRQQYREAPPASAGTFVSAERDRVVRNVPITIIPTSNSSELADHSNKSAPQHIKSGKNGKSSSPPSSKTNSLKKSFGNLIPGRRKSPTSRPAPITRDYYDGHFHGIPPASPCHSNSTQSSSSVHYDVPPLEEEHNTYYMAKNGQRIPYSSTRTVSPQERRHDVPNTIVFEESEKSVSGVIADRTRRMREHDLPKGPHEDERVVWFNSRGRKNVGLVKWVGRLEGYPNIYLGVEFEDKCGGGSGFFRGERLFEAKMDYAALLPLNMCMLEKDMQAEMQLRAFEATYAKNNHQQSRMPPPNYASIATTPSYDHDRQAASMMESAKQAPPSYSTVVNHIAPTQSYNHSNGKPQPPPAHQKPRLVDKGTRVVTTAYSPPGSGVGRKSPSIVYRSLSENESNGDFGDIVVNSCVEVTHKGDVRYGAVVWIGESVEKATQRAQRVAIVILDNDPPLNWERVVDHLDVMPAMSPSTQTAIFKSSNLSAIVPISALRTDSRFVPTSTASANASSGCRQAPQSENYAALNFGNVDSGFEYKACGPAKDLVALHGRFKGIQGHCNSCYLDATLYAMFVQCTEFDYILDRSRKSDDIPEYDELLRILTTEIVYPLRKFHYVRADHVLKFRQLLSRLLPDMNGLTCDEKDPEEILNVLFGDLLKVKPMLRLRNTVDKSSHESFLCPLIAEDMWSPEQLQLITLQYLIERSMYSSNVQFEELPKTLIVQLPRSGQQKLFDKIVPNIELDLTHLLHGGLRPCRTCSAQADVMCPECFLTNPLLLNEVTFCRRCFHKAHFDKEDHSPNALDNRNSDRGPIKEQYLQLSAVLSINTSHYVSFVRTSNNSWLFFDSMADRHGLSDGYNVPNVTLCDSISQWLTPLGVQRLNEALRSDGRLPLEVHNDPMVNRILTDCYICFYTLVGPGSPNTRRVGNAKFFA